MSFESCLENLFESIMDIVRKIWISGRQKKAKEASTAGGISSRRSTHPQRQVELPSVVHRSESGPREQTAQRDAARSGLI
jgi:hypothetical protein